MKLLTTANYKTVKGEKIGYLTGILYLAPADLVQGVNLCPFASEGCKQSCLYTAGRGAFGNVKQARVAKTEMFRDNKQMFLLTLMKDIRALVRKAEKLKLTPCIRLNGTSDIRWECIKHEGKTIFEIFPSVQFYDYTADYLRKFENMPKNYHLTFSRKENNEIHALEMLSKGVNVAMVFEKLPESYRGYKVISGDENDVRFIDEKGVIVGLTAKGKAKKDNSGFVIQN